MGNKLVEGLSKITTSSQEIKRDILLMNFTIVTACLIGESDGKWILVDTGIENSADFILESARNRFGRNNRPEAIILTHGHFDHVGSVIKLSELWSVPVYIHQLEIPYITGKKDYPIEDSAVDEGIIAKMLPKFSHTSIDISSYARVLPADGSVPGMSEWKWIHTPGHTKGHISLFREKDHVLIVGDAFSTTKRESILSVMTYDEQISKPPKYITTDWDAAENSVRQLMALKPSLAIPSHGEPMEGEGLRKHLEILAYGFDKIPRPKR